MKCALTKVLPFILTLLVGLVLGNFSRRPGFLRVGAGRQEGTKDAPYSRTWLVIHHRPQPSFPQAAADADVEPCAGASLRVRFDANGAISKVMPAETSVADDCTAPAIVAARQIVFTPATENGKPVSVMATVSYDFGKMHFTGADKKGRRFCVAVRGPVSSQVEIVSVEGAKETKGWRVVYE